MTVSTCEDCFGLKLSKQQKPEIMWPYMLDWQFLAPIQTQLQKFMAIEKNRTYRVILAIRSTSKLQDAVQK